LKNKYIWEGHTNTKKVMEEKKEKKRKATIIGRILKKKITLP